MTVRGTQDIQGSVLWGMSDSWAHHD